MLNSTPTDVIVLDYDSALLARFGRSAGHPLNRTARASIRDAFREAPVTPALADESKLIEAVRRLKGEAGSLERAWILLPDSWFRLNLIEVADLPSGEAEALEVVRWSIRKTLPISADDVRMRWVSLSREDGRQRVLVVSAIEASLAAIERAMRSAGVEVSGIESTGLNLWNAITEREAATGADRILIHVRADEFTTAVFRGTEPVFIRSRNLSGERTLAGEIRLSASYLRESARISAVENCYLAGEGIDPSVADLARDMFGVEPLRINARDYLSIAGASADSQKIELVAARGVFAQ